MTTNLPLLRAGLERRGIEHLDLTDLEVVHLDGVIRGWHVMPRTPANTRAISAKVWLAAAVGAGGRYRAPEAFGHPADLHDDGPLVDSVVLMAVVQRHFLRTRAQAVLDAMQAALPPLGRAWWGRVPARELPAG